ncbi:MULTISPECIES: hypothetical protein [Pseudomonas]|uniref:Yip1 domain-containing protein n=1 Tax=Pseudomonas wuhanensis TaxID=2954098 RepID=A0ABY9GUE3_9PSED|nr:MULTISPECIES: hypothetical protein [unclassified Pseudomonas]WLI13451.1 hypothetical protein PSH65_04635 [Pseudomonas sp. FP603]WLI19338.1 hypothetical protein PSH88_04635 [Pseudomonas sp. FP607]
MIKVEQQLESIHQELRGSVQDLTQEEQKSLKYYIRDIHQRLSEWLSVQGNEKDERSYEISWALGLVGTVGVLLAITRSAGSDIDWVREHTLAFRLWAVVLCTLFVGVSLERSAVVRSLWGFTITKFLVSIILSGVVLYARGKAAGYINGVFHIDASALPFTFVFTTALLVLKLLLPFVLTVALIFLLVHALIVAGWLKGKVDGNTATAAPLFSLLSAFVFGVILYFGWSWSGNQIADSRVPEKVYLMAHTLDFNYSHECANVAATRPVLFLGPAQESVLVAPEKLADFSFTDFFEGGVKVPTSFVRQRCDYKPAWAVDESN